MATEGIQYPEGDYEYFQKSELLLEVDSYAAFHYAAMCQNTKGAACPAGHAYLGLAALSLTLGHP